MSLTQGSQEFVYLLSLVKRIGLDLDGPVLLQCDNLGAIKPAQNPFTDSQSKHIEIKHHFVRVLVDREAIQLQYVPTDQNIAVSLAKTAVNKATSQFK